MVDAVDIENYYVNNILVKDGLECRLSIQKGDAQKRICHLVFK